MKKCKLLLAGVALTAGLGAHGQAVALEFDPFVGGTIDFLPYVTYGDGNSYSLPVSAFFYDSFHGGGVGPGNPYYVASSPGQISDLIVVATGASGKPVNENFAGMDNAYPTPSGAQGTPFFSTHVEPDPDPTGSWDAGTTWDVHLQALNSFLGIGNDLVFFFNNNQVNSGDATNQNLAAWMQITLEDTSGQNNKKYFDLTNLNMPFAPYDQGGGGVLNGNPALYTSTGAGPLAGDNNKTDYVLSGGQLCADAMGSPVACDGNQAVTFNHNLGADQAAYALLFPELNDILNTPGFGGYDVMRLDIRLGCDPLTDPDSNCIGRSLNNGYEQVFIGRSKRYSEPIPEPGTMMLMGTGLAGIASILRRRRKL